MKQAVLFTIILFLIGCIDFTIENNSNEIIPNYSTTLTSLQVNPSMQSNIIALSDEEFLVAIEDENSFIKLIRITQSFVDDEWQLDDELINNYGSGNLRFFDSINNHFLLGVLTASGDFNISRIDDTYNIIAENNSYESYIDTTYNNVDSIDFLNFSVTENSNEILLGGEVHTQGTTFSCVLSIDQDLNPLWFKTYFEESIITDLTLLEDGSYLVLNSNDDGTDLIRDNRSSSLYKKYNLSNDQLFFGSESFIVDSTIFLTGVHNQIGRLIAVDLSTFSAFVNEIEIYPVKEFAALYFSSDNIVTAGIHSEQGGEELFSSELESLGSLWCNKYADERYFEILDIIGLQIKGILISSVVEDDGQFYLHITRIDNEGATFTNDYSENCI